MEKYNYLEQIKKDVKNFIEENKNYLPDNREEIEEQLNDELWNDDDITGNETGSYFCNTDRAAEAIAFNWDLLADALEYFGYENINPIKKGVEWCDVLIRCYLLPQAISEVIEEICEQRQNFRRGEPGNRIDDGGGAN